MLRLGTSSSSGKPSRMPRHVHRSKVQGIRVLTVESILGRVLRKWTLELGLGLVHSVALDQMAYRCASVLLCVTSGRSVLTDAHVTQQDLSNLRRVFKDGS